MTKEILKELLKAMAIIILSSLPYIHDVITVRGGTFPAWVPDMGIQELLTNSEGYILGFSSYRVFIYTLFIHVFAHLGYLGWFFEAKDRLYRPFLLVPVSLSLYQIFVIMFDIRGTQLNTPNTKIILTIVISSLLAINFFFNNNKILSEHFLKHKDSLKNRKTLQTQTEEEQIL
ncbi:hypothetical protein [uncultured Maribacter sp.]|uniref:hypothetical protein n=1 Tax=uncultured Maribacter sp. TaxID=431308 RepID=UPI002613AF66|nr:hypothetical protein [uncultured Maribacter sp.]